MYQMLLYGFLLGIALTLLWQDAHARVRGYQDRKQAEFEAAVAAEAELRRVQARLREDRSLAAWGEIVSEINADGTWAVPRKVHSTDDPFADV